MTVATAPPALSGRAGTASRQSYPRRSAESDPAGWADRRSRGNLVVASRVVEKIAGQAAREVAAAGGRSGGFLGIGSHADLSARPRVAVELSGRTATVEVEIVVAYPASIRESTDRVRRRVIDRVTELASVEVRRVDITVTALLRASTSPRLELR